MANRHSKRTAQASLLPEFAALLAAGIARLRERQADEGKHVETESSLDFVAHQSGHGMNDVNGTSP